jgi:hypothetical protein
MQNNPEGVPAKLIEALDMGAGLYDSLVSMDDGWTWAAEMRAAARQISNAGLPNNITHLEPLLERLQSGWAAYGFNFLANEVEDLMKQLGTPSTSELA